MGLLSIFKRQADSPRSTQASTADASDAVQQARTRARQRLIGAIVLLGIGIIGFPLVFETQPRPIPVNIPIETPPKDGAPALTMPAARAPATAPVAVPAASVPAAVPLRPALAPTVEVITESRDEAGREVTAPAPGPAAAPAAAKSSAPAAKPSTEAKPVAAAPDGARARALLEGKSDKPDKPAEAGRFVVQVGAFADAAAAHETRVRVEKLGLKTYTQVASTPAGDRIRVRVGPFASRGEADKALAKARDAGLAAVVLTL